MYVSTYVTMFIHCIMKLYKCFLLCELGGQLKPFTGLHTYMYYVCEDYTIILFTWGCQVHSIQLQMKYCVFLQST